MRKAGFFIDKTGDCRDGDQYSTTGRSNYSKSSSRRAKNFFRLKITDLAQRNYGQVNCDKNKESYARNQVNYVPGVVDSRSENPQPGQHKTADDAHRHQYKGDVSQQLVVAEAALPSLRPVSCREPEYGNDHRDADDSVEQHPELVELAERQQVNAEPGYGPEQQQGACSPG